ncbi:WXG100 family type VII secretion target [Streptomyces sp. ME03-5684b]|uniref:WXG100 family type VII secretion target n=1 Tax=Streptomyces sp. ME03-5684b TaxID=3028681 RepID=UPI00299FB64A|nr:WXG100 family type VII secretion target [Streptomyces sp. ME03-5684b]MDX3322425.1 WXG100 family type VII secretion target [Streptomyces sp. ME03-5684b]
MTTPADYPKVDYAPIGGQPDGVTNVGGVNYRVSPEYVAQAASDTVNTAEQIRGQLAELMVFVTSLEQVWGGIAQQQFNILMQDYRIYSDMLHNALTGIAGGLRGTYVNYVESEQQNLHNLEALGEEIPRPSTGTNFD